MIAKQKAEQMKASDQTYAQGSRAHVFAGNSFIDFVVRWRLHASIRALQQALDGRLSLDSPILFACAGEGGEASWLCDLGFRNVTFSDLSPVAVNAGIARDPRLKGLPFDAENLPLADNSYDLTIVQDGLHHLPSPIRGFTEMLRVARLGALFIEPHDSMAGRLLGTRWERNGDAVNYVFRWTKRLVQDVASSFLGPDSFDNLSFSYWHHNPVFGKLGRRLGAGSVARGLVASIKWSLDSLAAGAGNQFSGIIVKRDSASAEAQS